MNKFINKLSKYILSAVLACCCLLSCQSIDPGNFDNDSNVETSTTSEAKRTRDVQFVVKNLSVDYVASKATVTSEGLTDLWVYEGGTLLRHQVSTDTDFGNPTINLSIGAHDLTFIASKAEGQTVSDGVWSCTKVKGTFGTVLEYTVGSSSTSKQVQLDRLNGKVLWTIEDAIPNNVKNLSASVTQCFSLDANLNGTNIGTQNALFDISSIVGASGVTLSMMVLPVSNSDGSTATAKIAITDKNGDNLANYTNDVEIKANRICNIHGCFFSNSQSKLMVVNNEWGDTIKYAIQ